MWLSFLFGMGGRVPAEGDGALFLAFYMRDVEAKRARVMYYFSALWRLGIGK